MILLIEKKIKVSIFYNLGDVLIPNMTKNKCYTSSVAGSHFYFLKVGRLGGKTVRDP